MFPSGLKAGMVQGSNWKVLVGFRAQKEKFARVQVQRHVQLEDTRDKK